MSTSPVNRVVDNSPGEKFLGREPQVKFIDGLHKTSDWFVANRNVEEVREVVAGKLTER